RFCALHVAVAADSQSASTSAKEYLPIGEIAHEPRVIDRADRADAHRPRRKLPEVRHEIGGRIAAQAARAVRRSGELLSIVQEVVLVQTALQECARVDARRAVRLEEHEI